DLWALAQGVKEDKGEGHPRVPILRPYLRDGRRPPLGHLRRPRPALAQVQALPGRLHGPPLQGLLSPTRLPPPPRRPAAPGGPSLLSADAQGLLDSDALGTDA